MGENSTSRKGRYVLTEGCYAYWYRFVAPFAAEVESDLGEVAARRTAFGERLDTFVGQRFEVACRQWLVREARAGRLPVEATSVGSWWGTDPTAREQTDIDAIAADALTGNALFCECKWRNSFDETQAVERLRAKRQLVRGCTPTAFMVVSKHPVSAATSARYESDPEVLFTCANELYGG